MQIQIFNALINYSRAIHADCISKLALDMLLKFRYIPSQGGGSCLSNSLFFQSTTRWFIYIHGSFQIGIRKAKREPFSRCTLYIHAETVIVHLCIIARPFFASARMA